MFVGIARIVLRLPAARSLKDRRRVVKSYKDRLRARLPVVVAELGDVEKPGLVRLGLATVSGEQHLALEVMEKATHMANTLADAILVDAAREVVPFGQGGSDVHGGIESALDAGSWNEKYGAD